MYSLFSLLHIDNNVLEMYYQVREAYRVFDKERRGCIEASELRMIFAALPERLSDQEIEEMLRAADRDGNYKLLDGLNCILQQDHY